MDTLFSLRFFLLIFVKAILNYKSQNKNGKIFPVILFTTRVFFVLQNGIMNFYLNNNKIVLKLYNLLDYEALAYLDNG